MRRVRSLRIAPKKRVKHSSSMPHSRTEVAMAAITGSVERPVASATQNERSKASRASAVSRAGVRAGEVDDVVGEPGRV